MPRLLLFAVAQKVIIDNDDKSLSIIGVLSSITAKIPEGESNNIPTEAGIPYNWGAGVAWKATPDDAGKTFEQKIELFRPDGVAAAGAKTVVEFSNNIHNTAIRGDVMPVGIAGEYKFTLFIRETVGDADWEKVSEFPIDIHHQIIPS